MLPVGWGRLQRLHSRLFVGYWRQRSEAVGIWLLARRRPPRTHTSARGTELHSRRATAADAATRPASPRTAPAPGRSGVAAVTSDSAARPRHPRLLDHPQPLAREADTTNVPAGGFLTTADRCSPSPAGRRFATPGNVRAPSSDVADTLWSGLCGGVHG